MLNHEPLRLADGEYRFACLVWDNEPLPSGQLVALAAEGLGWKKSTTYTVLKKLCERGVLQNADGRVTSLIKKEDVQQAESAAVVDKTFDGSLPRFVAAHWLILTQLAIPMSNLTWLTLAPPII